MATMFPRQSELRRFNAEDSSSNYLEPIDSLSSVEPQNSPINSQQFVEILLANPNITDNQIVKSMEAYGISPTQLAEAIGVPEGQIVSRVAATVPQGQTVTLGDTIIQPVYQFTGSGESEQVGGLENVITYKATDNKAGGSYTQYTPSGEVEKTGTQQEVKSGLKEFAIGAGVLLGLPTILNAGAASGATGVGLEFAGSGGAFDLANAGIAGGTSSSTAATATGLLSPAVTSTLPAATIPAATTAATALTPAASAVAPTVAPAVASTAGGLLSSALPAAGTVGGALASGALSSLGGAVTGGLSNLISGGLGTAGNLLQMQQSREATQKAQAMIEAETVAAKQAAQFRPVGMTTRFGTAEFKVDPTTGQLVSAGYTLTPEAKAQQDRFVALQNQGLTQAEQAQAQFAPLQTGAQRLFGLGNEYLAKTPEQVAQNYLAQQMNLLAPSREIELANLQTRLRNQGRIGLSVAQGGDYGATTPELQALFNARARQEAELAANAELAGQRNVMFGADLLDQGSRTMGQYYSGQTGSYAPYTTASGQVQGLEALGQQPLTMGIGLGQQAAQAGANVGRLGLTGAQLSTNLATSADATRNLAAQGLIAAGNPNAMFGNAIGGLLGGGARALFSQTPLGGSGFGTGLAYSNQDMGLYI
jgi:hypothetical protein